MTAPAELDGRDASARAYLKIARHLPEAIWRELRREYLEWTQAEWLIRDLWRRINERQEHELEGWIEAGLTRVDYEIAAPGGLLLPVRGEDVDAWRDSDPARHAVFMAGARAVVRKLSPWEVWTRGAKSLQRLRPDQSARLLALQSKREVVVRGRLIEFQDQDISPSTLRYRGHTLPEGEKFGAVVSPYSPKELHLFNAREEWVGCVPAANPVRRNDAPALAAAIAEAETIQAQALKGAAEYGGNISSQRLGNAQHNTAVLRAHASAQVDEDAEIDQALENAMR